MPDEDTRAPRPTVVNDAGRVLRLSIADLPMGIETVGRMSLPKRVNTKDARVRKDLGFAVAAEGKMARAAARSERQPTPAQRSEADALRQAIRNHPCHTCPDREDHARWAERYFRTLRDKDKLAGEIHRATGSIAAVFDRRCDVLRQFGYLEGAGDDTRLTTAGTMLRTLYAENDLVITECLKNNTWASLTPPALAAVVSSLLYSARKDDGERQPRIPGCPTGVLGQTLRQTQRT